MRDIGKNIKTLRQDKNMTQDELAEKLFVTRQTVSNYETGKSRPDVDMLEQIAQALDSDLYTLIYGVSSPGTDRKRKLLEFGITAGCLAVVWIGCGHLAELASDQSRQFQLELALIYSIGARPLLAFLMSWTAMQALGTFAGLSPLRGKWAKGLRWTVAVLAALYSLLMLSVFSPLGQYLPDGLNLTRAAYWFLGALYRSIVLRPHALLFAAMGCALWLGRPVRKKGPDGDSSQS